jgi:hypothetical protein
MGPLQDLAFLRRDLSNVKASRVYYAYNTKFGDNRYLTAAEKHGSPRARYRTSLFYGQTFRTR